MSFSYYHQDNHGEGEGMYYNGNAPSRMNPRIPIKRTNIHGEEVHETATLDDEGNEIAGGDDHSSLWIDPRKSLSSMDRIQEDFPLTPSAVYSKRLLANAEGRFDQDIGEEDNHGEDPLLAAATSAHHVCTHTYVFILSCVHELDTIQDIYFIILAYFRF
jgi:hypothetical protein